MKNYKPENLRPFNTEIARAAQKKSVEHRKNNQTIKQTLQKIMNCLVTDEKMLDLARENGIIKKDSLRLTYKQMISLAQVLQACNGDNKAFENVCRFCGEFDTDISTGGGTDDKADGVKDLINTLTVKPVDGIDEPITPTDSGENNE